MRGMSEYPRVAIVGAGAAGLAVAACLLERKVPATLFDAGREVGESWRRRYDALVLHTTRRMNALPFWPMAGRGWGFPSKDEFADYLEEYARWFGLKPRLQCPVTRVDRTGGHWWVTTPERPRSYRAVVVATGLARKPIVPELPGERDPELECLHSAQYRHGEAFRGRKVLVVGFGNSGAEIAVDLAGHGAHPILSARSAVTVVPARRFGVSTLSFAPMLERGPRLLADGLSTLTAWPERRAIRRSGGLVGSEGAFSKTMCEGKVPIVDMGIAEALKMGRVRLRPAVCALQGREARFEDGTRSQVDAVVWATGYAPAIEEFFGPHETVADHGKPHRSGRESELPGLFFVGFDVAPEGMIPRIAQEAPTVAARVAAMLSHDG